MINNYVDSGVEWLQDIPSHWGVKTIKRLFTESNTKNTDGNTNYLSIVKGKGVVLYSDKGNVGNKTSDHPEKYKMVEVDDIVINPMNIIIGSVGRSKYEGCLSSVYIVLKPNKGISGNYYEYIFSHKLFQKYLKRICYGIMELRESLNKIEFYVEKLPVPPIQEQQQISDYLDYKTSKINTLIEKTQQKVELLKEQRTSLINTTVTKGLNPNVEMKDSGVEWVGDIPKGWDLIRLKYLFSLEGGKDPKKIQDDNGEFTILGTGGEISKGNGFLYDKPTLLLGRKGTIDKPFLFNKPFWVSDVMYYTIQKSDITPKYLHLLFTLIPFDYYRYGSTQPSMSRLDYESMVFPIPKKEEREQIVDHLDLETSKIDTLITKESKRIELLKEYRQSLISDVVTGKVDVRGEVLV